MIFLFLFSVTVFFPGVHQDDTDALYHYFTIGNYSDWQPPIYTIWWHIFKVRWSEFIVNMAVYYCGLIYLSYCFFKENKKWQNDLLIIFSFYPLYFTQIIISLKDVPYTGFLVLSLCALILLQKPKNVVQSIFLWILFSISIFMAIGFKYNGVFATLPMLFYAAYSIICKITAKYNFNLSKFSAYSLSLISSVVLSIFIIALHNIITFDIFKAKHSYSSILVMYNDMANIECSSGNEVIPDEFFISSDRREIMCNQFFINYKNYEPLFLQNWSGLQNPAVLIYDSENTTQQYYDKVRKSWIKTVTSYPYDYIKYRAIFLYNILFSQWWWTPLDSSVNNNSIVQLSLAKIAIEERNDLATFNGIFLLLGTIIALLYTILRNANKFAVIVISSSLLQFLSLYLVLGVPTARFFLWNYLAVILTISLACPSKIKHISNNKIKTL